MNYKTFKNKLNISDNKSNKYSSINEEINIDNYQYIIEHLLPTIIKKHSNSIITEQLIKEYSNKVFNKEFSGDRVLFEIRKLNKLDNILPNKLDYILEDNSRIVINYETQELINNILGNHKDIIDYMQKNSNNFSKTINQIKGYH